MYLTVPANVTMLKIVVENPRGFNYAGNVIRTRDHYYAEFQQGTSGYITVVPGETIYLQTRRTYDEDYRYDV